MSKTLTILAHSTKMHGRCLRRFCSLCSLQSRHYRHQTQVPLTASVSKTIGNEARVRGNGILAVGKKTVSVHVSPTARYHALSSCSSVNNTFGCDVSPPLLEVVVTSVGARPSSRNVSECAEASIAADSNLIYVPTPVEWSYELLEYFHDDVSLPWWLAIVATTVLYRGCLALPYAIWQQRVFARIENVQPIINTYVEETKLQTALLAKERNWSKIERETEFHKEVRLIIRSLHMKEGCSPVRLSYVAICQVAIWVTVTTALGQMSGYYPQLFATELDIDVLQSLSNGGILWFTDLMETGIVLPIMLGFVNLVLVELWSLRKGPLTRTQHRLHNISRLAAIGSVPLATMMPGAIAFYWLTSSLFGLCQFALLRIPKVRRVLEIPHAPSEMKDPVEEMRKALKIRYQGKKVF